jgi:PPOX class probable F420-dependent enzyme
MELRDLLGFLRGQRFGVISSVSADGQPQAAVVGLAFTDEGEAIFDTIGSSRKARNLRRDPRASLVIWEGERTVQMEGRVDEPAGAEREAIVKVYLAAFPDGAERLRWGRHHPSPLQAELGARLRLRSRSGAADRRAALRA